jgi:hypothetical protein
MGNPQHSARRPKQYWRGAGEGRGRKRARSRLDTGGAAWGGYARLAADAMRPWIRHPGISTGVPFRQSLDNTAVRIVQAPATKDGLCPGRVARVRDADNDNAWGVEGRGLWC